MRFSRVAALLLLASLALLSDDRVLVSGQSHRDGKVVEQDVLGEPLFSSRVKLPQFCLGPAPFPENPDHLDYEMFGSAKVKKGRMVITEAKESQKGAIWSKRPLVQTKNWQVDLRFQVGGSPNKDHFGDGFAFWVAKERGVLSDAIGGPDPWTGLAVFFDTFKNDNFRNKRHPYVYGKTSTGSDQVQYKNVNDNEAKIPGCHVPFRNEDPSILDVTLARITLLNGDLTVIMRPRGSLDWVQCFIMKGVTIPENAYFGVTAMTGGLVDNHNFIQITAYGNVDVEPYSYAHPNNPLQMPDMWEAMRESGKAARVFSDWEAEDSMSDDLHWTVSSKVKSHVNDDYGDPDDTYGGDNPVPDGSYDPSDENTEDENIYNDYGDEDEDEEDEDDEEEEDDDRDRRKLNNKAKSSLSPQERAAMKKKLDVVIDSATITRKLKQQHIENARKMEKLHESMTRDMQQTTDHLHRGARDLRNKEHELNERILALGERLKVQLIDPFEKSHGVEAPRSWFWPFFIVVIMLGALAAYGYSRYRWYMKSHVL